MRNAANSAALPNFADVTVKYEVAQVFAIVTSHTKQRPSRHGSKVRPSGHLLFVWRSSQGSFVAGIFARVKERKMMSFKLLCRIIMSLLRLNDSACDLFTSIATPQKHVWGWQISTPKRKLTAILTVSSSRRSPRNIISETLSQFALCLADAAISLALSSFVWFIINPWILVPQLDYHMIAVW